MYEMYIISHALVCLLNFHQVWKYVCTYKWKVELLRNQMLLLLRHGTYSIEEWACSHRWKTTCSSFAAAGLNCTFMTSSYVHRNVCKRNGCLPSVSEKLLRTIEAIYENIIQGRGMKWEKVKSSIICSCFIKELVKEIMCSWYDQK